MRRYIITIVVAFIISLSIYPLQAIEKYPDLNMRFEIINNVIIVKIPDKNGKMMNFFFDSGSNDFLLDSCIASRIGINPNTTKPSTTSFLNGSVKSVLFGKENIFLDQRLNTIYSIGSILNMEPLTKLIGTRIDGLIGIRSYTKAVFGIDFKNNILSITDSIHLNTKTNNILKMKMLYSDEGNESKNSKYFRKLPCAKVRCQLPNSLKIEANLLFDTGFNKNFAFMTNKNLDSIITATNGIVKIKKKKISLGESSNLLHIFKADSIFIGDLPNNYATDVIIDKTSNMAMSIFGNVDWMCLAGMAFLKNFDSIYFDLVNREIFLIPKSSNY